MGHRRRHRRARRHPAGADTRPGHVHPDAARRPGLRRRPHRAAREPQRGARRRHRPGHRHRTRHELCARVDGEPSPDVDQHHPRRLPGVVSLDHRTAAVLAEAGHNPATSGRSAVVIRARRLPSVVASDDLTPRDDVDRSVRAGLIGLFLIVAVTIPDRLSHSYFDLVSRGIAYSVAVLSLVVLVGLVGQFSLAQAGFMGVGALVAAHLVTSAHVPFLLAVPLGGLATVPVGMVAAIPALRVSGVYLAVVTLSFGEVLQKLFFDAPDNGGTLGGVALARPGFLESSTHYYWFELGVLMALIAFVCMFRTRRTGRNLAAVRESEAAALSVGINLTRAKLTAFGLSAFIAGVGGVLYAANSQ